MMSFESWRAGRIRSAPLLGGPRQAGDPRQAGGPRHEDAAPTPRRRRAASLAIVAGALSLTLGCAGAARTVDIDRPSLTTIEDVWPHLEAFQAIADADPDGARAAGTPGYEASVAYVERALATAGYETRRQEFSFRRYRELADPILAQLGATPRSLVEGEDFFLLSYSGSADVAAPLAPVALSIDRPESSRSGCHAADFQAFPAGAVALVQRGGCSFREKAEAAAEAGAVAVVVFNQGDGPGRLDAFRGGLGVGFEAAIPVFSVSYRLGVAWSEQTGAVLRVFAATSRERTTSSNVIAETPGGRDDVVIMAGAHLDSVPEGAGMQDNASGSAALLAIALSLAEADVTPANKIRFAWWGAEEVGLIGARRYVERLSSEERRDIAMYLNFDMIASPNGVRFVLDGDASLSRRRGAAEAKDIEAVFEAHFAARGLPYEVIPLAFLSDYAPFFAAGVPIGGVYTGAYEAKTAEQAALFGGEVGAPLDPCYHTACDTIDNVSRALLEETTQAAEFAILEFALDPDLPPRGRR